MSLPNPWHLRFEERVAARQPPHEYELETGLSLYVLQVLMRATEVRLPRRCKAIDLDERRRFHTGQKRWASNEREQSNISLSL